MKEELDSMLAMGIIEPIVSPYASPVFALHKSDNKLRLITDLRSLNKVTEFDPYVMPRIDEILDEVTSARYITTLDLTKGFYQVPLDPATKHKSAFVTPFGQFCYNVLPFGMQNSSSTFQRLMDTVLDGCHGYARAYIDDICIYSETWDEHITHVNDVLHRIAQAGLTTKPAKCKFAATQVSFLGHTIGGGKLQPMVDKTEAVKNFPRPLTKKQVRAFLGLSGYYRKFVPNYATIAAPLIELTKKNAPNSVSWNEDCETAFCKLKMILISQPILNAPDFSKQFILQTDASNFGLGAVLEQLDDSNMEHPVLYLSRKLLPHEENYSIPEKECLAIVWAITKLKYYLYGRPFTVLTDHQPLKWLDAMKNSNKRLMRWAILLQEYTFTITYRKGIANGNADGLSRA